MRTYLTPSPAQYLGGTGSTTDAIDLGTAEVAGTLADGNVSDTLTIGAAGTVAWGALNAYPAACAAGSAITALGDTITCSAFMTATASNVFVNGGNSFGAAAVLGTNDANSLSLETNGVNRMTIDATGATSFTGSVAAASISTSGNIAATGTISASNFSGSHSGTSSGTNTGDVTVSGQNYITISGQALTVGQINLGGTHVTGTLGIVNGGTGSTTAATARTNLGAAASGANSDITELTGLTTDLSIAQGGTGASTFTANGIIYGNGTNPLQSTAAGTTGQCLVATTGVAPSWGTCGLGSESDTLQTVTARGATTTIASTFQGGLTSSGTTTLSGATTTISGTLTASGNTTIGDAATDRLTLTAQLLGGSPIVFQGATDNGFATTLTVTDPTANNTITLPNASGTVALLGTIALGADTTGNYVAGITAGNGISVSGAAGEGWSPSIAVNYGSTANTAVQGNVTLTCPSGSGNLTGGGTSITLGAGGYLWRHKHRQQPDLLYQCHHAAPPKQRCLHVDSSWCYDPWCNWPDLHPAG
jgi:hypothetical protein